MQIVAVTTINNSLLGSIITTPPNEGNTGGYRIEHTPEDKWEYSPIDIAVCTLSLLLNTKNNTKNNTNNSIIEVTDLSKWFTSTPQRLGELFVFITVALNKENNGMIISTYNIVEWKEIIKSKQSLKTLMKKNAPFTFRT